VNFILVGGSLLGACELIHAFVCKGKNCNKYAESIKRQITKFISLGRPAAWDLFTLGRNGSRIVLQELNVVNVDVISAIVPSVVCLRVVVKP